MKDPIRCNEISHSKTLSDSFCPLLSIIERGLTVRPSTFPSTWILKLAPFLFIQFAVLKSDATLGPGKFRHTNDPKTFNWK